VKIALLAKATAFRHPCIRAYRNEGQIHELHVQVGIQRLQGLPEAWPAWSRNPRRASVGVLFKYCFTRHGRSRVRIGFQHVQHCRTFAIGDFRRKFLDLRGAFRQPVESDGVLQGIEPCDVIVSPQFQVPLPSFRLSLAFGDIQVAKPFIEQCRSTIAS